VREGWGTKNKGSFWKPGIYRWQAHIDGNVVSEKTFYIQNFGRVATTGYPYFKMDSIKLYEGPDANVKISDRTYYSVFNFSYTRYVWVELNAKNLIKQFPGSETNTYVLPGTGMAERVFLQSDLESDYSTEFDMVHIEKTSGYQKWGNQSYKRNYWVVYLQKK
jgi:hypothetical protein